MRTRLILQANGGIALLFPIEASCGRRLWVVRLIARMEFWCVIVFLAAVVIVAVGASRRKGRRPQSGDDDGTFRGNASQFFIAGEVCRRERG